MQTSKSLCGAILAACLISTAAGAATPAEIRADLERKAREAEPASGTLSPDRGQRFFTTRGDAGWSCASCHTEDPLANGRHAKTGKNIAALAPAANPERFTDAVRVEKWFRRNCNDVFNRDCTAREKADVLAYLLSLRK